MTRIWMLCLLTALLHSAGYAAKRNAENPAKGKPAVEAAKSDKTDRKDPDEVEEVEEKDPLEPKKEEPKRDR